MLRNIERRVGTGLSGINDPTMPLYQALAGWIDGIGGGSSVPGLPAINYETALRATAMWRGVNIIAGTIGSMPFGIFDDRGDGKGATRIANSSPWKWLEDSPNPEVTPQIFWETSIGHCVLGGNCYWYAPKDGLGRIAELWPIEPKRVQVARDPDTKRKFYVVDGDHDVPFADYDPRTGDGEIIHIPAFSIDGTRGINIIRHARLSLQAALGREELAARAIADSSAPGGILTTDADLSDDQARRLKARWESQHRGLQNAYRVAVLDNGAKWEAVKVSLADLELMKFMGWDVQQIARILGIPPHLLADVQGSTSWGTGIEEQGRNMVTFTFGQWVTRFEQGVTYRVLGHRANLSGQFNLDRLVRGDIYKRYRAYGLGRMWGLLATNDMRRAEGMTTIDGGDDDFIVPTNQMLLAAMQAAYSDTGTAPDGSTPGDGGSAAPGGSV